MTRSLALVLSLLAGLSVTACGDDVSTPTSPSIPEGMVERTTRLFTGTLAPHGTVFYSFTLTHDTGVFLTLASVTPTEGSVPLGAPLGLALGVPRGTGCATAVSVVAEADLAAQIRELRAPGVHCAAVSDPGTLARDVAFAVRIVYYE